MVALKAWYEHDGPTTVETAADLDAVLDTLAGWRGRNMVQLVDAADPLRSGFLDLGIDAVRGVGVACYSGSRTAYWTTNGGTSVADEPPLYYYMGSDTEFPVDAEIALEDVRKAAHEFMANGTRPVSVQWAEDQSAHG
ncbi:Immunity protein Imm1 [Prauserella aidingensis]|uniref:Imm1 family immunity protein n=1 Tax=Prauserella aidingensis TaxID=387890 RepID=UPI0020A5E529|nr:Imm1 family immunity protein [Prauserella aidingensis]MCP2252377.1 Immunity protein Imm1 [Prauserella aidingensis]